MDNQTVKIAIPATGRLAEELLVYLANLGLLEAGWANKITAAMRTVKKCRDEEAVRQSVASQWRQGLEGITVKYDLRSGWRVAFSAKEVVEEARGPYMPMPATKAVIYGSDYPAISGIRDGVGDLAVIGFDELLASMLPYLDCKKAKKIRSFTDLNGAISPPNSTDVRVIAPFMWGLASVAGLFLMTDKNMAMSPDYRDKIRQGKRPVYVKGRYQGLAYFFLGEKADARPTESIEDAVKSEKGIGFDIVRTGNTVLEDGLKLLGEPFMFTLPVLTADISKYKADEGLRNFVYNVLRVSSSGYLLNLTCWEFGLKRKLGNLWEGVE